MYSDEVDKAVREAAARLERPIDYFGELLDTVIKCASYALTIPRPAPPPPFTILEGEDTVEAQAAAIDHLFKRPTVKLTKITQVGPGGSAVVFGRHLTFDACNNVSDEDLIHSNEYQKRAAGVPWPKVFVMERGKDRRPQGDIDNKDKRHQIDWYREGSHVEPMPNRNELDLNGNPYNDAYGVAQAVAWMTWEVFTTYGRGCAAFEEIVDEVMSRRGSDFANNAYNRNAVRDALRDCALFGLVVRMKENRKTVFVLPDLLR